MKKKEYNPFDWDNISIEKYYQIYDILNDEDDDDITKNVKLVATIMEKDEQEVWDMDLTEVGEYIGRLQFLNKFEIPKHPNLKIQLPNYTLVVLKDLSKINIGQYVDYQNFASRPLRESMEKILSIFLIPEGHSYNTGYDILDLQREMRENLSFRAAEGLLSFFLDRYSKLLFRSVISCRRMIRKTRNPEEKEEMRKKEKILEEKIQDLIRLVG